MVDFIYISTRSTKRGVVDIYPKFIIKKSSDLMIKGGDFYAFWNEKTGLWDTDEYNLFVTIDIELTKYVKENQHKFESAINICHMWDSDSGVVDSWNKYIKKQLRDSYVQLDSQITFANDTVTKEDYVTKKLPYSLEAGDIKNYDKLISILYAPAERHKIEWAIGSIVSGDARYIQKFMVLYGSAGTGKSTIMNIIQKLFEGYCKAFDAKSLGSSNNSFALESFKDNPLVAIQHDGDLSRIEDNTRINSLVSHETMTVNEKFKSEYTNQFKCFLFMGTNKPVKITDAKSGLIRRLIDVSPSGDKLPQNEYDVCVRNVDFELGAIAYHCLNVYMEDKEYYNSYIPTSMMGASNDFYNFVLDNYHIFNKDNYTTLKAAWEMYKNYCDDAKVTFPHNKRVFREELKNYFQEYHERYTEKDGTRYRSYYNIFRIDRFEEETEPVKIETTVGLVLDSKVSLLDDYCSDCYAQLANNDEKPALKWDSVTTKLKDINTKEIHYVKLQDNHIVIDFDLKDDAGNKSLLRNLEEASKWPLTYTELSKSGCGVHLHYIYSGDPSRLSRIYDENIEIKVQIGNSSLRRRLTKCNNVPIATISSGLPLKGEVMVNLTTVEDEKHLRALIIKNLNKEIHASTKSSMDFIKKILDDAYSSGMSYDISDLRPAIFVFASNSSNQAAYCMKMIKQLHLKSEETSLDPGYSIQNDTLVFFDVEVFPNLFVVCFAEDGERDDNVHSLINPRPSDIEMLLKFKLLGFNNRQYDNHIIYAALLGFDNEQLYQLSQRIINGSPNSKFAEAYKISYTDIYDFASAPNKMSLKKYEILLGIKHHELGLPWDKPVPPELWRKVADYCSDDVIATKKTFHYLSADWSARQILADLAGLTVNDTTNALSTKIILGDEKHPKLNWRDMGDVPDDAACCYISKKGVLYDFQGEYNRFDSDGVPYFPGYTYQNGKSTYRDEEVGEGGYVYSEEGIYFNVALLDVTSMHPTSTIAEELFGEEYTPRYEQIVNIRVSIKHNDYDNVRQLFDGKLSKYLDENPKTLSNALKTPINAVYGLTAASFDNPFRDPRNVDNIVAKRGALFMINLKHEVQNRGFTVAHIKTDSIKIPNATPEIIQFVNDYGEAYGYGFEHEATYDRICLVNKAVYIAKYDTGKWTSTGTQFSIPYVFKTLFSKEEIVFRDYCVTNSVKTAIYLDMNEDLPDVSAYEKELESIRKKIDKSGNGPLGYEERISELKHLISQGHNYVFVGKVGDFCPVQNGTGGGIMLREGIDSKTGEKKYSSVTGSQGYRWKESIVIDELHKYDQIDKSYFTKLVDDAIETISKYGDFEQFVSDDFPP